MNRSLTRPSSIIRRTGTRSARQSSVTFTPQPIESWNAPRTLRKKSSTRSDENVTTTTIPSERDEYRVFMNGVDMTPKPLTIDDDEKSDSSITTAQMSLSSLSFVQEALEAACKKIGSSMDLFRASSNLIEHLEPSEPCLHLNEHPKPKLMILDDTVSKDRELLTLTETETFYLFEMTSRVVSNPADLPLVLKDNETYRHLTMGPGRNRTTYDKSSQTLPIIWKSRAVNTQQKQTEDRAAFVSAWEMYDTDNGRPSIVDSFLHAETDPVIGDSISRLSIVSPNDDDLTGKMAKFRQAVNLTERILVRNQFKSKHYKYLLGKKVDPLDVALRFDYNLDFLWTYACDETKGRCVEGFDWVRGRLNTRILAVGYGGVDGLVCIWNIKNLTHPERSYHFASAITAVAFSKGRVNILAVGGHNGTVKLIDITQIDLTVIASNDDQMYNVHDPVNCLLWMQTTSERRNVEAIEEILLAMSQDGSIISYGHGKSNQLIMTPFHRIHTVCGGLKGIETLRCCEDPSDIPISLHTACTATCLVAYDPALYLVGTESGTIHRYSRYQLNYHLDAFQAHVGPVYSVEFSPFCSKVFLTAGADGFIRIWAESVEEPLIELCCGLNAVNDCRWSPRFSAIIVAVTDSALVVWDVFKRTHTPTKVLSGKENDEGGFGKLLRVVFDESGNNVLVGCGDGNVNVFALSDVPIPAFYPQMTLLEVFKEEVAIKKGNVKLFQRLKSLMDV